MEWMWNAMWAWFGWNVLAPIAGAAFLLFVVALCRLPSALRRLRCKHERFIETRACDAICTDCGKNLGFIGTVREERRALQNDDRTDAQPRHSDNLNQFPRPTGETYTPKHEGDLPGWER